MGKKRFLICILICSAVAAGIMIWGYISMIHRSNEKTADAAASAQRLVQLLEDDESEDLLTAAEGFEDSRERLANIWSRGPDMAPGVFAAARP